MLWGALTALYQLARWRCNDYRSWLAVGMALHSIGDCDVLLRSWIEWSRQSAKFEEGVCEQKWATFTRDKGLYLGHLLAWAAEDEHQRRCGRE
jgi:hypothetical protein